MFLRETLWKGGGSACNAQGRGVLVHPRLPGACAFSCRVGTTCLLAEQSKRALRGPMGSPAAKQLPPGSAEWDQSELLASPSASVVAAFQSEIFFPKGKGGMDRRAHVPAQSSYILFPTHPISTAFFSPCSEVPGTFPAPLHPPITASHTSLFLPRIKFLS